MYFSTPFIHHLQTVMKRLFECSIFFVTFVALNLITMYRQEISNQVGSLRFHQWSRKAYAAFASLKRHVTMGCVGKGITEVSLSKGAMCAQVRVNSVWADDDAVTDTSEADTDVCIAERLLEASGMSVCLVTEKGGIRQEEIDPRKNLLIKAYDTPVFVRKDTGIQSLRRLCVSVSFVFYLAYDRRIEKQGFGR